MSIKTSFAAVTGVLSLAFVGTGAAEGNRYDLERYYHSEISAAEAFLQMGNGGARANFGNQGSGPVMIDVRSLEEYAAGHPEGSYNVPYPRVCSGCDPQDEATLYQEVFDIVNGDTDRLIMTLCRTGSRSVSAGNVLAQPQDYGIDGPAFTNVRNIWEGFVGQYKYAYDGGTILLDENNEPFALDLNNNDVLDTDAADVFVEREDANPDKDGWRNFQGLPWTTEIRWRLAYENNPWRYRRLGLTPVE